MSPTDKTDDSGRTVEFTRPAPPEGVRSEYAPPDAQKPDAVVGALARFDAEVAKARAQPSRVMIALRSAELVERALPEDMRHLYAQMKYECFPKSEGGLGLQVDGRRNAVALNALEALRMTANKLIAQKRSAIESAS